MSRKDIQNILNSIEISVESRDISLQELERFGQQLYSIDIMLHMIINTNKNLSPVEQMLIKNFGGKE